MPRRAVAQATRDQLAAAAAHLRRPGWPADLDDVLAHALFGPCVRGLARCLARGERLPRSRDPHDSRPDAEAAHLALHARRTPSVPRLRFDPRRAAANDHDDADPD